MAHHGDGKRGGSDGPVDRDELLEALFHEALQLDASDRADYAHRQCAGDPELADELGALLAAHLDAPACLDQPAWGTDGPAVEDRPGDTIGAYHLVRMLGEGGMGSVYLAKQLRPLRRNVALKLIKPGMDTREVVARFDAERQVLAQLNHPHIAAVFDAGITPRGRPYFAMEYVQGMRITRYCDSRKLPLRKRLLLFRAVCDAVHHAHQKGVIHRDLKPGNILVTEVDGKPVPKIIDFGVAKAIAGGTGGQRTLCTRSGQIIGTPSYMSPEQAGAFPAAVDSRTDVYSLGVLLNELLTGFLPYELGSLRGADDDEVRRRLSEVEVVRPALRVALLGLRARKAAERRGCDPRGLSRQLRGDLDWVVLKALDRDPEARYASASELGADIANHLDGEPVTACSPGALYRTRKLVAKNRRVVASVAGSIVIGFLALVGFALSTADRNVELSQENAQLLTVHDAEMQAVLEREDTLLAACDAARDEAGEDVPYTTTVIRNLGDTPLHVGEVVELVGVGDVHPQGGMVVEVVRATHDSGRPPLGSMDGKWVEQEGHAGHAHRLAEPVPPGGYGVVVTHGLFARVRVDGSCGEIAANDALGVSAIPGLACLHTGEGAVVGFALDAWTVSQQGLIRAFVAPMPGFVTAQVARLEQDGAGLGLPSMAIPGASSRTSTTAGLDSGIPRTDASLEEPLALEPASDPNGYVPNLQDRGMSHQDGPPVAAAGVGAVVLLGPEPEVESEEIGTDTPSDSIPETGSKGNLPPVVPSMASGGIAVTAGDAGSDGTQSRDLRNGGVGRHAPGETGGTQATPPGSGDTPPQGGGVGTKQGGGGTFSLSIGPDESEGEDGSTDGDSGTDGDEPPQGDGIGSEDGLVQLWGDVDGDGLLDVLIQSGDEPWSLQKNLGQAGFEDITGLSGLADHADGVTRPIAWLDVELDGLLDLLALDDEGRLTLFRGRGMGRFDAVYESSGLSSVSGILSVSVVDSDVDGAPDIHVSTVGNGVLLLLNDGAGRFSQVVLRAADGKDIETSAAGSASVVSPRNG